MRLEEEEEKMWPMFALKNLDTSMDESKPTDKPKQEKETAYKFTKVKRRRYLTLISNGSTRSQAARGVGMSRAGISQHCRRHPEFRRAIERAELEACQIVESCLWYKITTEHHFGAIVFWLL